MESTTVDSVGFDVTAGKTAVRGHHIANSISQANFTSDLLNPNPALFVCFVVSFIQPVLVFGTNNARQSSSGIVVSDSIVDVQ